MALKFLNKTPRLENIPLSVNSLTSHFIYFPCLYKQYNEASKYILGISMSSLIFVCFTLQSVATLLQYFRETH